MSHADFNEGAPLALVDADTLTRRVETARAVPVALVRLPQASPPSMCGADAPAPAAPCRPTPPRPRAPPPGPR
ncbi:hypothetical protein ABT333_39665, partial [Streptomyces flaveolus]